MSMAGKHPFGLFALFLSLLFSGSVLSQPATLDFQDCFSGNVTQKLNVSTVYAQIDGNAALNLTVIGYSDIPIVGRSNSSTKLATLFTSMSTLTFSAWTNSTYLCQPLRPPSPLPSINITEDMYCPLPAGHFAFSTSIPWSTNHQFTTQNTRLHALDPYSDDLLCLDVDTTPLGPRRFGSPYGEVSTIFWATVGLAIAYWLVVGITRVVSARGRGSSRPGPGFWPKVESAGFILASAISGESLTTSPALMRFCSPSMRDIIFHSQWCAALAMVAVQWPTFAYPLLAQTAWATLLYNVTITQGSGAELKHWNPLDTQPYSPPSDFANQFNDPTSSLFINASVPNTLFLLPDDATSGISSFASTVGLRPTDLFGVCLGLFLAIAAGTIALSFIVWLIDWVALLMMGTTDSSNTPQGPKLGGTRTPPFVSASKDGLERVGSAEEHRSLNSNLIFRTTSRVPAMRKRWWKSRPDFGSFHGSTLVGNLVRILVLFHFPVTIFSCYQFTLGRSHASLSSVILAVLSFIVISLVLPVLLVIRLTITPTNKLYEKTRTLLALGPLYNHYRHGSQLFACLLFATNIAFGITIGCGQKNGTAQAIIILVVEVVSALVTSIWLPWGQGASMGLISFLFCVARIVIAVLLVILTPTISIGDGAGGWVAYGIIFILALVYLAFTIMLIIKLIEALVRIFGGIGFDRSKHVVDSGLIGACGLLGFCGSRKRRRNIRHRYRATEVPREAASEISSYLPPAAILAQKESTPSHHSQPPSVLRPEQALRPYREDSDDENGYIMGAWQPYPGYNSVDNSPTQAHPNTSGTSGFSRVGGGRATFDTPYAIATGSTLTFPSAHSAHPAPPIQPPSVHDGDDALLPTASVANIARQPQQTHTDLPPGAMPPHTRKQSQSAIVEDFNHPPALYLPPPPAETKARRASSAAPDEGVDMSHPKKKHWYHIRKSRRHSDGDATVRGEEPIETVPTPKSFVVIRDKKPPSS